MTSGKLATKTLLLALLFATPAAGQQLRTVPLDDWSYRIADAFLLRHPELVDGLWLAYQPWRVREIDSLLARSEAASLEGELERGWTRQLTAANASRFEPDAGVEYFSVVSGRYRADIRQDDATFEPAFRRPTFDSDAGAPSHRFILRHDFALQSGPHFALGWTYLVDSDIRTDPRRRTTLGLRETDAAFEVVEAYAALSFGPLRATVGRAALSLGPGRAASVFVSESIPALDQVRAELHADPVRFTALVASLSRERPNRLLDAEGNTIEGSIPSEEEPVPFDVTRTLYLHRVDWRIVEDLQLAISEAALVTGVDRGFELRFANPLLPFYVIQQESDETDSGNVDVVVNLEGVYTGLGTSRLYGDLFVQEFFIDRDKREEIGNQLAWRLGAEWADPFGWRGGTVGAEYTRADVFSYLHRGLNTNWTTFGVPIGATIGPDADQLLAWAEWWPDPAVVIGVDLLARRGGERSVATLESVLDAGNPDFPSGIVQRELRAGLSLAGRLAEPDLEGRLRISRRRVENIGNQAGEDGDFWRLSADLSYRVRIP